MKPCVYTATHIKYTKILNYHALYLLFKFLSPKAGCSELIANSSHASSATYPKLDIASEDRDPSMN